MYELPRYGTDIKASLYTDCLEFSLSEFGGTEITKKQKKVIKEVLSAVKKNPMKIKWNIKEGRFLPAGN